MPTFDTPEPISVTIELVVGDVRIAASDRSDTVVEVRPSNESDESDVRAAQQTRVEYVNGSLLIRTPKARGLGSFNKNRSVDVTIDLPTGSRVDSDAAVADVRCIGRLGECKFKTSTGHIRLERTGPLRLDTSAGNAIVDSVDGNAEITTGSGRLRIGELDGSAVVKNSNGNTDIGTAGGELRVRAANGDISIDHAVHGVVAKTANGSIRIGQTIRGSVVLKTAMGDLDVGIGAGTAAWLDVHTGYGSVHNSLADSAPPEQSVDRVEIRAHTSYGDITIRRS